MIITIKAYANKPNVLTTYYDLDDIDYKIILELNSLIWSAENIRSVLKDYHSYKEFRHEKTLIKFAEMQGFLLAVQCLRIKYDGRKEIFHEG